MLHRCVVCHQHNGAAPFALDTYFDVRTRARQIVEVVSSRYMPPWSPEQSDFPFANDRRMTAAEIAVLRKWAATGAADGTPTNASTTRTSVAGWRLGTPDLVLGLEKALVLPADGEDQFRNVVLPVDVPKPAYVRTVEIKPGNRRAVHHIVGAVDRTGAARRRDTADPDIGFTGMDLGQAEIPGGQSILWSPGRVVSHGRPGIGWRIDSSVDIVLQLHLLPTGKEERIQPSVAIYFTTEPPTLTPISVMLEATEIDIPAGVRDYEVVDEIRFPVDVEVLSIYPHAHYLGSQFECTVAYPDGKRATLLRIDDWDLNWQDEYEFLEPVVLPAGTTASMRITYDNSVRNIRNPHHPPRRVRLGNKATDEMGTILLQLLTKNERDRSKLDETRWQQRLATAPMHPTANHNLGNIYEARGEFKKALACYRRVVEVDPDNCVAHDNVGCVLSAMGRLAEAASHFARSIEINPQYALAHNHWGAALMREGDLSAAVERLTRALQIWPQFPEARLNLGEAELRRGDAEQAMLHFRAATEQFPNHPLGHFNLGTILMQEQKFVEAESCFRRAVEADEQFAEAFNNLGICLFQQNELEAAATQFRKSIELKPGYTRPKQNLKIIEQRLKGDAN